MLLGKNLRRVLINGYVKIGIIILGLVIVNVFLFQRFVESTTQNNVHEAFLLGNYQEVIDHTRSKRASSQEMEYIIIAYLKLGDYSTPKQILEENTKFLDEFGQWYRILSLIEAQEWGVVRDMLERLTHPSPIYRALYLQMRALALFQLGKGDDARILIDDSRMLDPFAPGSQIVDALLLRATGSHRQARDLLDTAILNGGRIVLPTHFYNVGLIYFSTNNFTDAHNFFVKAAEGGYSVYNSYIYAGRSYHSQQLFAQAREWFERAGYIREDAWSWRMWIGRVLIKEGLWDEALVHYEALLTDFPRATEAYGDLIELLGQSGDLIRARKLFTLAQNIAGSSIWQVSNLLNRSINAGLYSEAREYAQTLQELARTEESRGLARQILRTLLFNFSVAMGGAEQQVWYDRVMSYWDAELPERWVLVGLHHLVRGERAVAMERLREVHAVVTERDLDQILALHELSRLPQSASLLEIVQRRLPELDQLWLDRYRLEREQDGEELGPIARQLLDQAVISFADEEDMQAGFARYFSRWWRHMDTYIFTPRR